MKWDFSGTLQMLPTIYGVDFVEYMKIMLFPTLLAGTGAFFVLWMIFHKLLKKEMEQNTEKIEIKDKILLALDQISEHYLPP